MSPMGSTSPITVNDPAPPSMSTLGLAPFLTCGDAVGLARDQIQRAEHRRPERGLEEVVAHREALRVVPDRRHRIAVEVREVQRLVGLRRQAPVRRDELADGRRKQIHLPVVVGDLLLRVAVILIGGRRLRWRQAIRIDRIGAVGGIECVRIRGEQRAGQAGHRRRARKRREQVLARQVRRMRVRREVVIERDVLLKDDDDVLDDGGRQARRWTARRARRRVATNSSARRARGQRRRRVIVASART